MTTTSSSGPLIPKGFLWGVATASFQTEGGINNSEIRNNWYDWETQGKVEPSGIAVDFWNNYEQHFEHARALGVNAFRMSIEWARVEPIEGEFDDDAIEHYSTILATCKSAGLEPLVTLHHFTHPHWAGPNFWRSDESPERYQAYVERVLPALTPHCHNWVTLNEINIYALQTYFAGMFPPGGRLNIKGFRAALDNLVTAHVLGYGTIKGQQPTSVVSTNNLSFSTYEIDRLITDILVSRRHGVDSDNLTGWLRDRRSAYYGALQSSWNAPNSERFLRALVTRLLPLDNALPKTRLAVAASAHECTLDTTQLDYYNPRTANHLRIPGHKTAGGRNWLPGRLLWDDLPSPKMLTEYSRLNTENGLDLWIVENGLCNRVTTAGAHPRLDGWTRVEYLKKNIAATLSAIEQGIPIGAYFHWCLVDNYEWGSYEPRFGIYGIDRHSRPGEALWLKNDSMGDDSAATFKRIIEGVEAGDLSVLK